jgi:hypothetical protein
MTSPWQKGLSLKKGSQFAGLESGENNSTQELVVNLNNVILTGTQNKTRHIITSAPLIYFSSQLSKVRQIPAFSLYFRTSTHVLKESVKTRFKCRVAVRWEKCEPLVSAHAPLIYFYLLYSHHTPS